jgi:hypothetical protein
MSLVDAETAKRQEVCASEALHCGLVASAQALVVSGPAVGAAVKFWPWFKKSTNVSSRTALIVSPFFAAFFYASEHQMVACARRGREMQTAMRAAAAAGGAAQ